MSGDPHTDKLIQDINCLIKDISDLGLQRMLDRSYEQIVEALRYLPKEERQSLVARAIRRVEEIDDQLTVPTTELSPGKSLALTASNPCGFSYSFVMGATTAGAA